MEMLRAQYQSALSAAQAPDPATKALTDEALGNQKWLQGGDYRQAPHGVFMSLLDPAIRKQQRELSMNAGSQGIAALGADKSSALKLNAQNNADQFEQDSAANYQGQVADLGQRTAGILGGLGNQETNKRLSILGNLGNMYQDSSHAYQQQAFKPGWGLGLLQAGIGQAGAIAGAFAHGGT